ncbi:hypothetical protein FKW77_006033 [Venturia effusa]|uniref:Uncharacterized protein n=1 Tax=Venturia effusa TaxID=50376 RepID=A0A517LKA3_9PEZI|nr:hypothetical protein FKW77_006033 [Venturia effusa]
MSMVVWLPSIIAAVIIYKLIKAIRNIFFHPLSHIPGPKLAAASRLYEWYYDCILIGQYCFKIRELHDEYGPVIRIGPNEVHIRDSEYFDTLYANTARLDKDPWFYGFLDDSAAFNTSSEIVHQRKISKVESYFSKANVQRGEVVLVDIVNSFVTELDAYASAGKVVYLKNAFKSNLPAQDRTPFVLEQEAVRYIAAGAGSTARCMENAIYHILSDPAIKSRLTTEIRSAKSSPGTEILSTHQLEQLPYLAAVERLGMPPPSMLSLQFPSSFQGIFSRKLRSRQLMKSPSCSGDGQVPKRYSQLQSSLTLESPVLYRSTGLMLLINSGHREGSTIYSSSELHVAHFAYLTALISGLLLEKKGVVDYTSGYAPSLYPDMALLGYSQMGVWRDKSRTDYIRGVDARVEYRVCVIGDKMNDLGDFGS